MHLGVYGSASKVQRSVMTYEIAFGTKDGAGDFEFVLGGKLPGSE